MKWLTGSFLSLIILAFCKASATHAAVGTTKTISPIAGWCLLVPPFIPSDPPGPLQLQAPLGDWTEMDSTKTAADCEEQRNNMTRMYQSGDTTSMDIQFEQLLYHYAVCVSSADPRLKGRYTHHGKPESFPRLFDGNLATPGYGGPPVQHGPTLSPDPSSLARKIEQSDLQRPILMMLLGLAVMATAGSLGGWLVERGSGLGDTLMERYAGPRSMSLGGLCPAIARQQAHRSRGAGRRLGALELFATLKN